MPAVELSRCRFGAPADSSISVGDAISVMYRPFFNGLVKYMDLGPVVAMCWEGENVVKTGELLDLSSHTWT